MSGGGGGGGDGVGGVGWWRANRWRLVVLVVALAVLGALTWRSDAVQGWWASEPHRSHAADAEGWAQVGDVRARLAGIEIVDWLDDGFDGRVEAPDGYTLWAVDLSVRSDVLPGAASAEEAYSACEVVLLDTSGREFSAGASSLPGMPMTDPPVCTGAVSSRATQYFLTPDDAEPAEVRLVEPELLPDYWSLSVR
ncbi:hypothetical protein V5D56_01510 [Cellulosimicrobium sp. PMB13]|uniref:hypothetical protein n=1 Tax=Cellulosimicrobium sp. PMB13 TaxID=3120158 RepID=UPI003F4C9F53